MQIVDLLRLNRTKALDEIGIEIEIEGINLPRQVDNYWVVTNDGSLRGESFEYVSNILPRKNVIPAINSLKKELKLNSGKIVESDRAGVHIHLNFQDKTVDQVFSFIVLFYILERHLLNYCGNSREGNLFCLRSSDADSMISIVLDAVTSRNLKGLNKPNDIRYAALNIASLFKYGSLEVRSLKTPEDLSMVVTWIDILLKVKDFSVKYTTRELVEGISREGADTFLRGVFDEYFNLITMGDQNNTILLDGVRRVQDIAYASLWNEEEKIEKIRLFTVNDFKMFPNDIPLAPKRLKVAFNGPRLQFNDDNDDIMLGDDERIYFANIVINEEDDEEMDEEEEMN